MGRDRLIRVMKKVLDALPSPPYEAKDLKTLEDGSIEILFEFSHQNEKQYIKITINDEEGK